MERFRYQKPIRTQKVVFIPIIIINMRVRFSFHNKILQSYIIRKEKRREIEGCLFLSYNYYYNNNGGSNSRKNGKRRKDGLRFANLRFEWWMLMTIERGKEWYGWGMYIDRWLMSRKMRDALGYFTNLSIYRWKMCLCGILKNEGSLYHNKLIACWL